MNTGRPWFRITALVLGFIFLYLPILLLIVYSFNKSRLVTVWGGFSTQVVRRAAAQSGDPRCGVAEREGRARSPRRSRSRSARWRAWR